MSISFARWQAARVLSKVIHQGRSLNDALNQCIPLDDKERPLIQHYGYGVCRHYFTLKFLLHTLLSHPLREKEQELECLLLLGLFECRDEATADHVAVSQAVSALPAQKTWARGLVNAVLRNYLRQRDEKELLITENPAALYAHPKWMMKAIQQAYPHHWQAIVTANNQHAGMSLRVNNQKGTRENYLAALDKQEIHARPGNTPSAILLEKPCAVSKLPGFSDGAASVQDEAAQIAATLLTLRPGLNILDACAAPGGKTGHLLEIAPENCHLTAVDIDALRVEKIKSNLQRLHLTADVRIADLTQLAWWDGEQFDRILLDAPCSGTGVIRRRPDIKLLRRPDDIAALTALQWQLLTTLWQTLCPGGELLYITCSILPAENRLQIQRFLAETPDATEVPINIPGALPQTPGQQILPGSADRDGFYYAKLCKLASR
jgi:16S rRNA (cytosine967-C5)-methyltransferase